MSMLNSVIETTKENSGNNGEQYDAKMENMSILRRRDSRNRKIRNLSIMQCADEYIHKDYKGGIQYNYLSHELHRQERRYAKENGRK